MNTAAHKNRLDRLSLKAKHDDLDTRILFDRKIYDELAAEWIISAETLEAIRAKWGSFKNDPFECCTVDELRRLAALCDEPDKDGK